MIGPFQESDGSVSMRRCLATFFALLAGALFYLAFGHADKGWIVFIPGIVCVLAVIMLLFFTTWSDLTELIQAAAGIASKKPGVSGSGSGL